MKSNIPQGSFFSRFEPSTGKTDEEQEDNKVEELSTEITEEGKTESEIDKMPYADEEKDVETPETESPNTEEEEDDSSPFEAIINYAADKGILHYDEDKEYEGDGEEILAQVIEDTLAKRDEERNANIPEEYKSILKHLQAGRPLEEWVDVVTPIDYDSIDITDEENQKQLIIDHLELQGMDEEDIKEKVQEYEDLGTLEKGAKTALKYLKKADEKKVKEHEAQLEKEITLREENSKRELADFKRDVLAIEKLGDFVLDKDKREKLFNHITKPVGKNGESQLVLNQKNKDKQLLLAYLDMVDSKFEDIKRGVETKVTSNLRQKLTKFTDTNAEKRGGKRVEEAKNTSVKVPKGIWDTQIEIED